ncbi:hypothetical protein EK21DRAFT_112152 [Setomelanomma holmii]|uniref:Uncharacterized protein n=1 Tax=Setomelanomma holmii TaxID=210430 RepID=A0A9P4HB90_9PLEO|nr:hypothetical protein EK21DRAFT_112152 [Setomelanomma holmii]
MARHQTRHGAGRQDVQDLISKIDEYLAMQADAEEQKNLTLNRRGSQGTLFVDYFDGFETPKISYRNHRAPDAHAVHAQQPLPVQGYGKINAAIQIDGLHFQKATRASWATSRHSESASRGDHAESAMMPPPLPLKCLEVHTRTAKAPPRHDSAHSRPPPLRNHVDEKRYELLQSHYATPTRKPIPTAPVRARYERQLIPKPRRDFTFVHYHRDDEQGLRISYNPTQNAIHRHDPSIGYAYDYNGRIVHIHRSLTGSIASRTSEYVEADAAKYKLTDKPLPPPPAAEKKIERIVLFVRKLLHKLEEIGVLGKMRQKCEEVRKARQGQSWVEKGYVARGKRV